MEAKLLRGAAFSTVLGPCNSKPSYLSGHKKWGIVRFRNSRDLTVGGLAIRATASSPNWEDDGKRYSIEEIRDSLIRQEDSIIFGLVERAQFCHNGKTYEPNAFPIEGFSGSLMEYILLQTEELHDKVGRYKNPEENAFFPDVLPEPMIPLPFDYPKVPHPAANLVNINNQIWGMYFKEILPKLVREGSDDGNYGSTACCDVICLQALSKRIHYGKFVAEAKFREKRGTYTDLIRARDKDGLMNLLTDTKVEKAVRRRVDVKTKTYGQEVRIDGEVMGDPVYKIKPGIVGDVYWDWIMPLTKQVQIQYLLRRLD